MVKVRTRLTGTGSSDILCGLPKLMLRLLSIVVVAGWLGIWPSAVRAQSALQSTEIVVGAPAQALPGNPITVQAVLGDSQGHPLSKAEIYFTVQGSFLHNTSDEVLAQAVTNANGQAVATFADDFSGPITLNAEFRGDDQYSASTASTEVAIAGQQQAYAEHVGVDLPGLNVPPISRSYAAIQSPLAPLWRFVASLWPTMNGWPLAAALLLVWSNYFLAITFVFRLAGLSRKPDTSPDDFGRSL